LECTNFENFKNEWCINVNASADGKKLRTYKLLKNEFGTEKCVELFMPKKYRSVLCKFRCGVAPIRIETISQVLCIVKARSVVKLALQDSAVVF
jgi:hypothetical protein